MIHGVKRLFEEITQREVRTQIPIKEGITNENYLIMMLLFYVFLEKIMMN